MPAQPTFTTTEVAYCNCTMVAVPDEVALDRYAFLYGRETFPIRVDEKLRKAFMVSISTCRAMTVAPDYCLASPAADHSWIVDKVAAARADPGSISGEERDQIEEQLRRSLKADASAPKDPDQCGTWVDHWSDQSVEKSRVNAAADLLRRCASSGDMVLFQ